VIIGLLVFILLAILFPGAIRLIFGLIFFGALFTIAGFLDRAHERSTTSAALVRPDNVTSYSPTQACYYHSPIDPSRPKYEQCEPTQATSKRAEDIEAFES